jgi:GDP-4-dehydro-6-deoxy-D-mannose reductase
MKKVMITGCSGFLGKYLSEYMLNQGWGVIGITDEIYKNEDFKAYQCDIRNQAEVDRIFKVEIPDLVFHLAAIASVGYSWANQRKTYEINLLGSLSVFEAVLKHCAESRIVCMSSAELYGDKRMKITEKAGIEIRNPYALSKYAMEILADLFIKSNSMNILKIRSFNFSGPAQDSRFVIADFARQIAEIEQGMSAPRIQVGNLSIRRDFSDVRDIVRYLFVLSQQAENGLTYNLCSGNVYTIEFLLNTLLELSKKSIVVAVDRKKLRPIDIPVLAGDNSVLRERFGLKPEYKIQDTLKDILDYWRDRV